MKSLKKFKDLQLFACWVILHALSATCWLFSKLTFSTKNIRNTIRVQTVWIQIRYSQRLKCWEKIRKTIRKQNSLDPDQAQQKDEVLQKIVIFNYFSRPNSDFPALFKAMFFPRTLHLSVWFFMTQSTIFQSCQAEDRVSCSRTQPSASGEAQTRNNPLIPSPAIYHWATVPLPGNLCMVGTCILCHEPYLFFSLNIIFE